MDGTGKFTDREPAALNQANGTVIPDMTDKMLEQAIADVLAYEAAGYLYTADGPLLGDAQPSTAPSSGREQSFSPTSVGQSPSLASSSIGPSFQMTSASKRPRGRKPLVPSRDGGVSFQVVPVASTAEEARENRRHRLEVRRRQRTKSRAGVTKASSKKAHTPRNISCVQLLDVSPPPSLNRSGGTKKAPKPKAAGRAPTGSRTAGRKRKSSQVDGGSSAAPAPKRRASSSALPPIASRRDARSRVERLSETNERISSSNERISSSNERLSASTERLATSTEQLSESTIAHPLEVPPALGSQSVRYPCVAPPQGVETATPNLPDDGRLVSAPVYTTESHIPRVVQTPVASFPPIAHELAATTPQPVAAFQPIVHELGTTTPQPVEPFQPIVHELGTTAPQLVAAPAQSAGDNVAWNPGQVAGEAGPSDGFAENAINEFLSDNSNVFVDSTFQQIMYYGNQAPGSQLTGTQEMANQETAHQEPNY